MTTSGPRNLISVKCFLSGNDYLWTPKTNKQLFTAITIWRVIDASDSESMLVFSAFFEIYTIYIPSHRSVLKTFAKSNFFLLSPFFFFLFFFARALEWLPKIRKRSDRMSAKTRKVYILYQYYRWDRNEKRKGTPENGRHLQKMSSPDDPRQAISFSA